MARRLVSDVIIEAQRRMPDMNAATALDNYNRVNAHVHERYELNRSSTPISLISEQATYPLDPNIYPIYTIDYETSATARHSLRATEITILENEQSFRAAPASIPGNYYISSDENGVVIGLYPTPNTATDSDAGYPRIVVYHSLIPDALTTATNEYIPAILPADGAIYWTGMCALFAEQRVLETAMYWKGRFQEEATRAYNFVNRRNIKVKPQFTPTMIQQRRVT